MGFSAIHLNRSLLCAVDIETTGLDPHKNEIIQLCILPLGPDITPTRQFPYVHLKIKPENTEEVDDEALRLNRKLYVDCINHGMERWNAVAYLEDWFEKLNLPRGKGIVALGANLQFDFQFLREFLGGPASFNHIFRSDYRDIMLAALHHNDLADWHSERIPFPKVNLVYLASTMGIPYPSRHDAMADCLCAAEVYRRMMRYKDAFAHVQKSTSCQHEFDEQDLCTKCKFPGPQWFENRFKMLGYKEEE